MKRVISLLASCVIVVSGGSARAVQRKPTPTPSTPPTLTTLRAERPQVLMSGRPGALETRLVSVRVKNIGSRDARQVQVILELEAGLAVALTGPKTLRAHGSGLYVSSSRLPGVLYRAPQVTATCLSCRN